MLNQQEIAAKFWKALESDRTMMLGLDGVEDGHARPMTAMAEHERAPIWFFTATDNAIARNLFKSDRAIATFASKGHELFAAVHGRLAVDTDRAVIDRLWNPFIAAWYPGGKDDPKLALLRLDAESAEVWLDERSLFAGIRMMLGMDPKQHYRDKVATVKLG